MTTATRQDYEHGMAWVNGHPAAYPRRTAERRGGLAASRWDEGAAAAILMAASRSPEVFESARLRARAGGYR